MNEKSAEIGEIQFQPCKVSHSTLTDIKKKKMKKKKNRRRRRYMSNNQIFPWPSDWFV
jgi:hypothetical protein